MAPKETPTGRNESVSKYFAVSLWFFGCFFVVVVDLVVVFVAIGRTQITTGCVRRPNSSHRVLLVLPSLYWVLFKKKFFFWSARSVG